MGRSSGPKALAAVVAVSLALGACARLSAGGSGGFIDHPTGPADLVLRVEVVGGFRPATAVLRDVPPFTLVGNGRVIAPGPQVLVYPGPALPNLQVREVTEAGVQRILRAARDAGLMGPDRHYDYPLVADAATTRFVLVAGGERHVVSAYALGEEAFGEDLGAPTGMESPAGAERAPGLSEEERGARRRLARFRDRLLDLGRWLPPGSVGEERPYEPAGLRVFVTPDLPVEDPALRQRPLDWPLPEPLAGLGRPLEGLPEVRCAVVSGEDLQALRPLLERATELTPWRSGGRTFGLAFRPLLPDESGCPAAVPGYGGAGP